VIFAFAAKDVFEGIKLAIPSELLVIVVVSNTSCEPDLPAGYLKESAKSDTGSPASFVTRTSNDDLNSLPFLIFAGVLVNLIEIPESFSKNNSSAVGSTIITSSSAGISSSKPLITSDFDSS